MNVMTRVLLLLIALMVSALTWGESLTIRGGKGEVTVDAKYGDILSVGRNGFKSGSRGLWSLKFKSGMRLDAAEFKEHPDWYLTRDGNRFIYREGNAEVTVEFVGTEEGVELRGSVLSRSDNPPISFELPARMVFDPKTVERFHMPQRGNYGQGIALKRGFFEETSVLKHHAWKQVGPHPWSPNLVAERDAKVARELPEAVKASKRGKVGFVYFECGPEWGALSKSVLGSRIMVDRAIKGSGAEMVDIGNHNQLVAALNSEDFRFIFNAYGDLVPMCSDADIKPTIAAIGDYIARGGRWVSPVDYTLSTAYVPGGYFSFNLAYPNLFMDFCRLQRTDGVGIALYGVRPRPDHKPWENPRERHFVAGSLGCGGCKDGGYVDHSFAIYAKRGEKFVVPAVRLDFAESLDAAVVNYSKANDINRPLSAKMSSEKLAKLKEAPIVTIYGSKAKRCAEVAEMLPVPAVIHIASYLKGGFDREYPEHLPTNPRFGGDVGHRELIERVHRRGHLYMPYTNPTWWCDHPRSPTFIAAGEEPLLINLDGSRSHETYAGRDGWTTCFWHPAVIAANRKTVTQFTTDLPVDILFQDQCGARNFRYDINPAAPTPVSYTEGLLAQIEDDALRVPLGTEDGWDKVANAELCIFGMSWQMIPRHLDFRRDDYQLLQKELISPEVFEIEPLAARLMHEKCMFYCHDLSGSVYCERLLPWYLALGYNLSYDASAERYDGRTTPRAWERYIATMQKYIVSHIAGQPLVSFRHNRAPLFVRKDVPSTYRADDGVMLSVWGEVRCVANLGDVQREVAKGVVLEKYGYVVEGLGFRAEYLAGSHPVISAVGIKNELVKDDDGKVVFEMRAR